MFIFVLGGSPPSLLKGSDKSVWRRGEERGWGLAGATSKKVPWGGVNECFYEMSVAMAKEKRR